MFQEVFPILSVADLSRSRGFYRDLLGCEVTYRFPDDGEPVFVAVQLGPSSLGIGANPDATERAGEQRPEGGHPFELCVYTEDCDAAIERLRGHGVPVLDEPADQPWGERLVRVADPDGNRVIGLLRL
jgi:lactoylglutathione lyase